MWRDVLVVDLLVASSSPPPPGGPVEDRDNVFESAEKGEPNKCIRICTTHLESLQEHEGYELRPQQLAVISMLLKEQFSKDQSVEILGGLVGGDMNSLSALDRESHKAPNVDLQDVWEDNIALGDLPSPDGAGIRPDDDETCGRAEGHTWGYQPRRRWPPKRMDKFFVTGGVASVALEEALDRSGNVGRLGVGLKTEHGLWVSDHFGIAIGVKVL